VRLPRVWFTVRQMMVAVAVVALVLGMLVACLRWFRYVQSTAECFNETGDRGRLTCHL
jgi:heme/copper-type cytochrome/quinol oxidase subunit 2